MNTCRFLDDLLNVVDDGCDMQQEKRRISDPLGAWLLQNVVDDCFDMQQEKRRISDPLPDTVRLIPSVSTRDWVGAWLPSDTKVIDGVCTWVETGRVPDQQLASRLG
jgi:hypothetical protein